MALRGAVTSIFLPHAVTAVPIPYLCSTVGLLAGYFTLPGQTAFLTLVLCVSFKSSFFPPLSLSFLLLFSVFPTLSFISYTCLLLFFFLPLTLFPAISYRFLSCPSCTTQTLLLPSLFIMVWYRHYNPLSISVLLNCSLLSSPSSSSLSPVLQCTSLCSFCLLTLHVVLLPWSSAEL